MSDETHYKVILSVNGKQIPIADWSSKAASDTTLELARLAYRQLVLWTALIKERPKPESNAPYCPDHQLPMAFKSGKYGTFYSCTYKSDDGSYCKNTAKAS